MCSLTIALNLGPVSALLPAPSLVFITEMSSLICLFIITWVSSLSPLYPFKTLLSMTSILSSHYLCCSLQHIEQKVVVFTCRYFTDDIYFLSQPSCSYLGLGTASVGRLKLSCKLLHAFFDVATCARQEK